MAEGKKSSTGWVVAYLTLFVALIAAGGGAYKWYELYEKLEAVTRERDQLLAAKTEMEALSPADIAVVSGLSKPGFWRPVPTSGQRGLEWDGRHPGLEPQPISLTDLGMVGALEPSSEGLFTLYIILANKRDEVRPRMAEYFPIPSNMGFFLPEKAEIDRMLTSNDEAREKLQRIQGFLNEHGQALVLMGKLQE